MINHIWYLIKLLFTSKKKFYYFLYKTLGYLPNKISLFETAFIHKSASGIHNGTELNNERLEYLGDTILDAVVAEFLYLQYPKEDEGFLTKMKAKIVNRDMLDLISKSIGISEFIKSHTSNSSSHNHLSGNAFEALVGAVFLDKGYEKTKEFITHRIIKKHINLYELEYGISDYKSHLLEWSQKNKVEINIDTLESNNYTDNKPEFYSKIIRNDLVLGTGLGKSKKEAEQNASKKALEYINKHHIN